MSAPTLLFLHAHPDDECILTGATIAAAARRGWRTLVGYGTRGDAGETNTDLGGESLGERRAREALEACTALGVARVEFLGYDDSGMAGAPTTENPGAFCNAALDDITARLLTAFDGERIDVVIGYDRNGTYGHPDHVQVHHAAHHAARHLGAGWVMEATYDREYLATLDEVDYDSIDESFASAGADLTHFVEGEDELHAKLRALASHRSQVPDDWDFDNPDVVSFARRFGTEWFIAAPVGKHSSWSPLNEIFLERHTWSGNPPLSS